MPADQCYRSDSSCHHHHRHHHRQPLPSPPCARPPRVLVLTGCERVSNGASSDAAHTARVRTLIVCLALTSSHVTHLPAVLWQVRRARCSSTPRSQLIDGARHLCARPVGGRSLRARPAGGRSLRARSARDRCRARSMRSARPASHGPGRPVVRPSSRQWRAPIDHAVRPVALRRPSRVGSNVSDIYFCARPRSSFLGARSERSSPPRAAGGLGPAPAASPTSHAAGVEQCAKHNH